ncbi:MAG TPA: GAF domain-containing sensor histidine kinase [Chloroflexota bacterium]
MAEDSLLTPREAPAEVGDAPQSVTHLVRRDARAPRSEGAAQTRYGLGDLRRARRSRDGPAPAARSAPSRLQALSDAAATIVAERSLEVVLQRIVDLARELVRARYGALGVADERGTIQQFYTSGITPEERAAIGPLPQGRGLLGVLIREGKPLRVADIAKDPRSVGFPPNHPPMTSLLGVPIVGRRGVLGDLYLTDKDGGRPFSAADERLILLLSRHAAVAIENAELYAQLHYHIQRLHALREVSAIVTGELDFTRVLDLVARKSMELTGADGAAISLLDARAKLLRYVTAVGKGADTLRGLAIDAERSLGGWALARRAAVRLDDVRVDAPGVPSIAEAVQARSAIFVPLEVRGEPLGVLVALDRQGGRPFRDEDVALLEAFGHQAAIAIANARLHEQVQRLAVLEERQRIARDLHDGIIQAIYGAGLGIDHAARILDAQPEEARTLLRQAVVGLDGALRDIRAYIKGLRSEQAVSSPVEQLERVLAECRARHGVDVTLQQGASLDALPEAAVHHLVHVVREALANAVRHGLARHITVALSEEEGVLQVVVRDDGRGFDPDTPPPPGHHGLRNMAERAQLLGGSLAVESRPGRGTTVALRVPLETGSAGLGGTSSAEPGGSSRAARSPLEYQRHSERS